MALNLKKSDLYFNRELSWLKFNERVLEEAKDPKNPTLERLKFLSIFSSNLDEFFMIRVAGLKEQIHAGIHELPIDGMSPQQQISKIATEVHPQIEEQSRIMLEEVLPELRKKNIRIRYYNTLNTAQKEYLKGYYKEKVFPVLTPLAVDPTHPFPQLRNLGLNLLVELREPYKRKDLKIAVIPVPPLLNRFIPLPGKGHDDFILLEELIVEHLESLFHNMVILNHNTFRVTRNADFEIAEAEADDLLKLIERELRKRRLGTVIRLEVSDKMSLESRKFLKQATGLQEGDIYDISGYIDLASFMFLMSIDRPALKDEKFTPTLKEKITSKDSIFESLRQNDILLHHPYDSFNHVIDLVQEAAKDPQVLAIKQTLYRTSGKSPIVQALKDAVANGKQVTALIELKARFDEETNIVWARELERSGVNVIYGVLGLKTHCKLLMIVRKEEEKIVRYLHMSTGNYNAKTAKLYTDFGFMTSDEALGKDAAELFNLLTGYSGQKSWRKFFVAPINMRTNLAKRVQSCIKSHDPKNPSRIRMVMNSLVDPQMIQWLYKASNKGIKVDLIIRGICCLKPGIKGVSENISVRSIVGRFLEHTRVYEFKYDEIREIYLGSADLMQRNLDRRMEVLFPIENPELQEQVAKNMDILLKDNVKARHLNAEGFYVKVKPRKGEKLINAQEEMLLLATERRQQIDTIH